LFAVALLADGDARLRGVLDEYRSARREQAHASVLPPEPS